MTDAALRDAALAQLAAMMVALRKTAKGLKGAAGSPGPNWSAALKAHREAVALVEQIAQAQAPPPPPPPDVARPTLAPQTYNRGSGGQDARYCVAGLPQIRPGVFVDNGGFEYDENGLSLGGRSGNPVPGLKPADQMDGRGSCDPYSIFPPWPDASYKP